MKILEYKQKPPHFNIKLKDITNETAFTNNYNILRENKFTIFNAILIHTLTEEPKDKIHSDSEHAVDLSE